ncbi:MAG: septal ring lytic transglycosylase RlpA family protein [Microvirga sp.]
MNILKLPLAAALLSCAFFAADASAKPLQRGAASWYGPGFHGRKTASGERFNAQAMTAAHKSLPFGTKVRVVNETTGRSVVVRINDRGPYAHGRIIDLAQAPARALGIIGTSYVSLHTGG